MPDQPPGAAATTTTALTWRSPALSAAPGEDPDRRGEAAHAHLPEISVFPRVPADAEPVLRACNQRPGHQPSEVTR
ncbi:hypothetical protein [Streptomyces sp. NPDC050988]|uniref:hypothetical protein n=1 Tax=Streptomyces sp. NPDC050988 TaxID=3365637 RepID=UPI00378D1B63